MVAHAIERADVYARKIGLSGASTAIRTLSETIGLTGGGPDPSANWQEGPAVARIKLQKIASMPVRPDARARTSPRRLPRYRFRDP